MTEKLEEKKYVLRSKEIDRIYSSNPLWKDIDELARQSKNIYNISLHYIKQYYSTNKFYKIEKINASKKIIKCNIFSLENLAPIIAYKDSKVRPIDTPFLGTHLTLPTKVIKGTLMNIEAIFKSYMALKYHNDPLIRAKASQPRYKKKTGRFKVTYTKEALSIKNNYIKLSGTNISFKCDLKKDKIKELYIIPSRNHYKIVVSYKKPIVNQVTSDIYIGIDLGLNNIAAITSNDLSKPKIVINGNNIKHLNHTYNIKIDNLKSRLTMTNLSVIDKERLEKKLTKLYQKRTDVMKSFINNLSTSIVDYAVSINASEVYIGHNVGWKQGINLGKLTNRYFMSIPYNTIIDQITYKCQDKGIKVCIIDEKYTSKCSFLDNEEMCYHKEYKGVRLSRGLFKSNDGTLINADINGALNILRKAKGFEIFKGEFNGVVKKVVIPNNSKIVLLKQY